MHPPFDILLEFARFVTFELALLRPDCVATVTSVVRFLGTVLFIVAGILALLLIAGFFSNLANAAVAAAFV